jgi:hypothetical protein
MYVRSMVVKGKTYYQIVEGRRDGDRVRQRVILALGRIPDPRLALKEWRRDLRSLERQQGSLLMRRILSSGRMPTAAEAPEIARLSVRRKGLQAKIETLAGLIKSKSIGKTPARKGERRGE